MGKLKTRQWHQTYDDVMFGITERTFFGLQTPFGLTADRDMVKRWYPKGPIRVVKVGVQHTATQGGTEVTINFKKGSSTIATVVASTDSAPFTIASKSAALSTPVINPGSYITVSNEGTVATGSIAVFIDWVRAPKFRAKHKYY